MAEATITRRSFLKTAAIAAAATGIGVQVNNLAPNTAAYADVEGEKIIPTACKACITDCGVLAHVVDGRVVRLEKDPADGRAGKGLCPKGLAGIAALYHPNRMKYPMKLVGERGSNEWERVSWEEAIETVTDELLEMKAKYGAESLMASVGGGGHPYFFSPMRLCTAFGGGNGIEPGNAQCYIPRFGAERLISGYVGDTSIADGKCHDFYFDDCQVKAYVMWGTGPAWHAPSNCGRAVSDLRKKGVKTVVVDPRFTADASKADVWLPLRAGTDAALFMAWMNYIIDHELYDEDFCLHWTNAPLLVNPVTKVGLREADVVEGGDETLFMAWDTLTDSLQPMPYPYNDDIEPALFGTYDVTLADGTAVACPTGFQALKDRVAEWTLEKAADVCWLDPEKIEEAILIYAERPSGLTLGVATDQFAQSSVTAMSCAMLEVMMGNIENPGNAFQSFPGGPDSMAKPFWARYDKEMHVKRPGAGTKFYGLLTEQLSHIPSVWNAIETGKPYSSHIWWDWSGNKLALLAEPQRWVEAFYKMDFNAHTYIYPTSFTVECADYMLPTVEWLEALMVKGRDNNRYVVRQPCAHLYEGINMEYQASMMVAAMAKKGDPSCAEAMEGVGGDRFWWNWKEYEDYIAGIVNASTGKNQTWEELCELGAQEWIPEEQYRQYYVYKQINEETGLPTGFQTQSGKCEVYGESFVHLGRTGAPFVKHGMIPVEVDYDPLPYYFEPDESPLTDEEFPLVMTNGRVPFYHHGTLRNNPYMRELYPTPETWIHPDTAAALGIKQGDWVRVTSRRSTGVVSNGVIARAKVTSGVNPGQVYQERFWNPEFLEEGQDARKSWTTSNVNTLSNFASSYDPLFGSYVLRGYTVKVEKIDGPAEGMWYKPEDFEPWLPQPSDATPQDFISFEA